MKHVLLALGLLWATTSAIAQAPDAATAFRQQIEAFIDEWHDDAAHSRLRYFDKMAADGVYIGTDKTERWTRDEFKAWAKPYFERPTAWAFHATRRNVAFSRDHLFIWFDEQLDTQMGLCQASGVIRNTPDGLRIEHYQLSVAIPNDLVERFAKDIREFEAKPAVR
jgi:hypothetical protein